MHEPHCTDCHIESCTLSMLSPPEPCHTHKCSFPSPYMGDTLLDGMFPGSGASHKPVACCSSSHMRSACGRSAWPPCGTHRSSERLGPAGGKVDRGLGGRAGGRCGRMCCRGGRHLVTGHRSRHRNAGGARDPTEDLEACHKSNGRIWGRAIWGRRSGIWGRTRWKQRRGWRTWRK
jgi:hypothetical protein